MTVEEKRRELFEATYLKQFGRYPDNYCPVISKYLTAHAQGAWWAFNAALDVIEIELPSGFTHHTGADYTAYVVDADQVVESIESLNLGIKIK